MNRTFRRDKPSALPPYRNPSLLRRVLAWLGV